MGNYSKIRRVTVLCNALFLSKTYLPTKFCRYPLKFSKLCPGQEHVDGRTNGHIRTVGQSGDYYHSGNIQMLFYVAVCEFTSC